MITVLHCHATIYRKCRVIIAICYCCVTSQEGVEADDIMLDPEMEECSTSLGVFNNPMAGQFCIKVLCEHEGVSISFVSTHNAYYDVILTCEYVTSLHTQKTSFAHREL